MKHRCLVFNGPAVCGNHCRFPGPSVRLYSGASTAGGNLQPCCVAARGVGGGNLVSHAVRHLVTILVNGIRRINVDRALPSFLLHHLRLVNHHRTCSRIRRPRSVIALRSTRQELGFRRLFCVRLGVLHRVTRHQEACDNCVFSHMNTTFGRFCSRRLPFALAATRGHIIRRVHNSIIANGRVGHLLRNSINSNGALITLLTVLLTVSGNCRTYVVTPARVLTRRRITALRTFLRSVPVHITLLANTIGNGHHRTILSSLAANRLGVLMNARTVVRRGITFRHLNVTVVSRRRHFNITRETHL